MPLKGLAEVERNLDRWYRHGIYAKARQAMEEIAALLEGYAKTHHPWTPQTGHTDVSTRGFISEATPKVITAVLSAGVAYDIFLELARDGKWAWIWPAIEANRDMIRSKLQEITR